MKRSVLVVASFFLAVSAVASQSPGESLMRSAAGTALEPASSRHSMLMTQWRGWHAMLHGTAFIVQTDQGGPRGGDDTYSANDAMASLMRPVGRGFLMVRTMLSLDPLTVGKSYPLLFQTGETADGRVLIDRQHPHDFFMELAVAYAQPVGRSIVTLYVAPVGDPALGPVAFPHRASAAEIPGAVLSHHYQDSTHIAFSVVTFGFERGPFRLEGSGFYGGEPDENRWDLDGGTINSWSARVWYLPTPNVAAQVSRGFLKKPEALEPGDATRTTASISYTLPLSGGQWASTLVWGGIYKTTHRSKLNSYVAETTLTLADRHHLFSRLERVDKDELFPHPHRPGEPPLPRAVPSFPVESGTAGYTFDAIRRPGFRAGVGGSVTLYRFPEVLEGFYGQSPRSAHFFIRIRPSAAGGDSHHH